jgi:hypothetical protein
VLQQCKTEGSIHATLPQCVLGFATGVGEKYEKQGRQGDAIRASPVTVSIDGQDAI